ncbi:MAG: serine O-acetyltransferase EpsC [Aerococcus sp.]|nr:serine O-acetyltransferase EpsC [Aerococcus sp.]
MIKMINRWLERAHLATYIQQHDANRRSLTEIFWYDAGVRAIFYYRRAHELALTGHHFQAERIMAHAKRVTGIEIHPKATIGRDIFIDHGVGTVIGETAVIGDRVTILHGVTLGSDGRTHTPHAHRHPVVDDDAYIGAHAQLVGAIHVGHHAKIGAGAVVIEDVPPYATAVGVPARNIRHRNE